MTVIVSSVAEDKRAAPVAGGRNAAFDRSRSFIILLVLIHHSVIPYTYYGHTDGQSFLLFDAIVTFNDSFFMAAMFLLSGLFTWSSLRRKGARDFLRGRWLRLGLPFAIGAVILMPLAYYAVELRRSGPGEGFIAFWWKTVTVGPWESGPIWFLGVLLAFDMLATVVYLRRAGHCRSHRTRGDRETGTSSLLFLDVSRRVGHRLRAPRPSFRDRAVVYAGAACGPE